MNRKNAKRALLILVIFQFMVAFLGRSVAPLGVVIGEDLSLSKVQIGLLPSALFLGQSLASIPAGIVVDRLGTKKMLFVIGIGIGLSYFFMTLAFTFTLVLLAVVGVGIFYGSTHPTTNRGILSWYPVQRRGFAMGIKQTGVTVGSALAALVVIPLSLQFGWRGSFQWLVIGIVITAIYLSYVYEEKSLTITQGSSGNYWEALKSRPLLLVTISAFLLSGSQMIMNTYIIFYAIEQLKIPLLLAGSLLVISEVGGSIGRLLWGKISDRFFNGRRIIILLIISIIGLIVTSIFTFFDISYYVLVFLVFCYGVAVSGFNGMWMNATTEVVSPQQSGLATGVSIMFASWGVIIGPPLFGSLVEWRGAYDGAWVMVAVCLFLSAVVLLRLNNRYNKSF